MPGHDDRPPRITLDAVQAFHAMRMYLEAFNERAPNDLQALLFDLSRRPDGGTKDPAAWFDWLESVEAVVSLPADSLDPPWPPGYYSRARSE